MTRNYRKSPRGVGKTQFAPRNGGDPWLYSCALPLIVDTISAAQRSYNMSRIKGRDTRPEMTLRRHLHAAGYRYRVGVRDLPGKPDLVFPSRKRVIFVNGCFWHSHDCKYSSVNPKTNAEFWAKKRAATTARDRRNVDDLQSSGWLVLTVWECELRNVDELIPVVRKFLDQ